ncbi:hypothetical protein Indivirus_1_171 [Indivirus ILV1]|uniref:DUF2784 family protein n=1 Tax=Indivirus ILV1 TaxID=1977633 RepID=A0A1V0SD21_9VIRU|nr:hypothetical protein Indivirus_1_171 [Indivirus ILV1]
MLDILLKLITFLHTLFVIFVVITPFTNMNYFLMLHAIFLPFVMLHWICNDNTCVLTLIERNLRKKIYGKVDEEDCITCRLIEPVYDFRKNYATFSIIIYAITIGLWFISLGKLGYKYHTGNISDFTDLFTI